MAAPTERTSASSASATLYWQPWSNVPWDQGAGGNWSESSEGPRGYGPPTSDTVVRFDDPEGYSFHPLGGGVAKEILIYQIWAGNGSAPRAAAYLDLNGEAIVVSDRVRVGVAQGFPFPNSYTPGRLDVYGGTLRVLGGGYDSVRVKHPDSRIYLSKYWPGTEPVIEGSVWMEAGELVLLKGNGRVDGAFYGASGTRLTVGSQGTSLRVGDHTDDEGFDFRGSISVGSHTLQLDDSDYAYAASDTTIAGGTIKPYAGEGKVGQLFIGVGRLSGWGRVEGKFSGNEGSKLIASGGDFRLGDAGSSDGFFTFGDVSVDDQVLQLDDSGDAYAGGTTTIAGGTIRPYAGEGLVGELFIGTGDLSGWGRVEGRLTGSSLATLTVSGGDLRVGDSSSADGVQFSGDITVGDNVLQMDDADFAYAGGTTTLAGGIIEAPNGLDISSGALSGWGRVDGPFEAAVGSTITVNGGDLRLGDAHNWDGFSSEGDIAVGNNVLQLDDYSTAYSYGDVTIAGGTIRTYAGEGKTSALRVRGTLSGYGEVDGPIGVEGPLTVSGGDLSIGNSSAEDGCVMTWRASVAVEDGRTLTLNDSNTARTDGTLSLDNGTLNAPNGLFVKGTLAGTGNVNSHVLVGQDGSISPGDDVGVLHAASTRLAGGSLLSVDLSGTGGAGIGHDQFVVADGIELRDALLDVSLGYAPNRGDQFVIIDNQCAEPVAGTFRGLREGAALEVDGERFTISYQGGDGNDVVLVSDSLLVADAGGPYTLAEGGDLTLDASASVAPYAVAGNQIASFRWDLDGDGQFDDATSTQPVVVVPWAGLAGFGRGHYNVALQVTDSLGDTSTDTTTLTITYPGWLAVAGISPSLDGGSAAPATASLEIEFTGTAIGGDLADNYELRSLGADGLLGTADDVIVPLSVDSFADTAAVLGFAPLSESVYRLTVRDTITNSDGLPLDGDDNFSAGGDYTGDFVVNTGSMEGILDASFGDGGTVATDFGHDMRDIAYDVAIQPDGKIVAVGYAQNEDYGYDFALARYLPDGSLDGSFGTSGTVTTDFGYDDSDEASAVVILPDGKIVVAGYTRKAYGDDDFALARYLPDGSLDVSFGTSGMVTTDFGFERSDEVSAVVIQPDGKIVAVGYAQNESYDDDFALARYLPDGTLDASFGESGIVLTDFGGKKTERAYDATIQPDGKIVVTGSAEVDSGLIPKRGSNASTLVGGFLGNLYW